MVYLHGRGLPLEGEAPYYTLRFCLTTTIPILTSWPIPNYLYIFIFKGEDLAWGMLHVAGRGLPLKDGALYYTLRFPLYHRHSPYLPIELCLIIYLFICFFMGENLALGVLHVAGRGLP